ncbi:hypothetical protein C8046_10955 [Serinibacter arcticus]|uniref:Uncharacterized protein n=1 Tax=Serinibacter arcticus TaxID=1655435 RepID=A0A2U1ZVT0_9MICO|nr:hypothetical protein [Serinibacter arcticus]PWD51088.1 hypothetical protein C8046_10955 [Serinibacter arcticus]
MPTTTPRGRSGATGVAVVAALGLTLAACGAPGTSPADTAPDASSSDDAQQYAAFATLLEKGDGGPRLCLGGVNESYPPQCGGPVILGLDWADVADAETASGVTWGSGWVVGTYDGEAFSLTEPVRTDPPAGVIPPTSSWTSPEALCEDPFRGGREGGYPTEAGPDGPALDAEGASAVGQLQERSAALPGYVELFVSDGYSEFNVLLTESSDVDAAHSALREVWQGFLCVAARDLPSNAESQEASAALNDDPGELGLLSWGADTVGGRFGVEVVLADDETRARITDLLSPWYEADDVDLTGRLVPVEVG